MTYKIERTIIHEDTKIEDCGSGLNIPEPIPCDKCGGEMIYCEKPGEEFYLCESCGEIVRIFSMEHEQAQRLISALGFINDIRIKREVNTSEIERTPTGSSTVNHCTQCRWTETVTHLRGQEEKPDARIIDEDREELLERGWIYMKDGRLACPRCRRRLGL